MRPNGKENYRSKGIRKDKVDDDGEMGKQLS
uniref:Uncharacterized protein n=1 Tax=Rhizophora mucronata TaxID=61149 RepID=A0A2P2PZ30_RHIMU